MTATLAEKIVALDEALTSAGLPHAFGGALALAFHVEEPRATRDIDVNLFVPAEEVRTALAALPRGVSWSADDIERVERDGQVRLFWGETPVDLFFSTHPFHDTAAANVSRKPFGGRSIPVLGADELAVFKAFFDRTRDWADLEAMAEAGTLDVASVLRWLQDLLGPTDRRIERFRRLLERPPSQGEPRFAPGAGEGP